MTRNYKRQRYFIERSFQTKFIFRFCFIVVVSTFLVVAVIFLLTSGSTTVAIENTKVTAKSTADFILPILVITFLMVSFIASLVALFLTLMVSHRIVGPAYRLKIGVNRIMGGQLGVNFTVRKKDQLQDLAKALRQMDAVYKDKIQSLKESVEELDRHINGRDLEKARHSLNEIKRSFEYFKTK